MALLCAILGPRFNEELKKFSNAVSNIKAVLEDAETHQIVDERMMNWLRRLKAVSYDAEDLLDECELEGLQQESQVGYRNCTQQVSHSFKSCLDFKQILFRHLIGQRIRNIKETSEKIQESRPEFHFQREEIQEIAHESSGRGRETDSTLTEPLIFGRNEDKKSIIQILLDSSSCVNDLLICPIVGVGGLGKTTLAQLVYNDQVLVSHFDTRIWISVSEDFGVKRILKMIIQCLSDGRCDLEDLDPMHNLLKKLLNGRKYLLVLDDVWDYDMHIWYHLLVHVLACGCQGSSIIVTTRLQAVVDCITGISSVITRTFYLSPLQEDESWSLFQHYAFGIGDKENAYLIEIGKAIVANCGGIPLAIKAVGSLLNSKREEFWRRIRDSHIWHWERHGEDNILPALRLSYLHLRPIFRRCFAYCSVYPKGWTLNKERLIHQWMANGIVRSDSQMEAEDIGNEIFNTLLQFSFFMEIHEDKYERVTQCKMHNLMHELACSVMENECSRMNISQTGDEFSEMGDTQRVRHLSLTCDSPYSPSTLRVLSESQPYLQTLMFLVPQRGNVFGLHIFLSRLSRLKHLRVLELGALWSVKRLPPWIGRLKALRYLQLENTGITLLPVFVCNLQHLQVLLLGRNGGLTSLPSSVGNLKKLRYLDLSYTGIKVFPESVCSLTDLQTLKLLFCPKLEMLPRDMKNMKSLRNLIIGWEVNKLLIRSMPVGIGELSHLEMLELFVVSKDSIGERKKLNQLKRSLSIAVSSSSEGGAGIRELRGLQQLKGRLTIENIRHVHDPNDALAASLKDKAKLSELYLYWGVDDSEDGDNEEGKKKSQEVLKSLKPHPNLQVLKIRDYLGVDFPVWLENCAQTLPYLHTLELSRMPNAVHHLHQLPPNLQILWIWRCPKLRLPAPTALPSSIVELAVAAYNDPALSFVEALPKLSKLRIGGFSEDETLPEKLLKNLTSLRDLQISSCSKLKRLPTKLENIAMTLTKLELFWCPELEVITEEEFRNLTSLENLRIASCVGLTSLPNSSLRHLTKLKDLYLVDCPKLEMTAVGFRHLVSLKVLQFRLLPQLTFLPDGMQHVTTLQCLTIEECKNLKRFPVWLQQHLSPALHYLEIRGCHPELHRRCKIDKREVWHKISHLKVINAE